MARWSEWDMLEPCSPCAASEFNLNVGIKLDTFLSHCVKLSSLLSASRRPINNWTNKAARGITSRCGVPLMHIDKLRNPNHIWTPLSFCLVAGRENSVLFPVERLIFGINGKSFDLSAIITVVLCAVAQWLLVCRVPRRPTRIRP